MRLAHSQAYLFLLFRFFIRLRECACSLSGVSFLTFSVLIRLGESAWLTLRRIFFVFFIFHTPKVIRSARSQAYLFSYFHFSYAFGTGAASFPADEMQIFAFSYAAHRIKEPGHCPQQASGRQADGRRLQMQAAALSLHRCASCSLRRCASCSLCAAAPRRMPHAACSLCAVVCVLRLCYNESDISSGI